jgi:hypothetical protein
MERMDKEDGAFIENVKVDVITRPRVYVSYNDMEPGRDKNNCYERVTTGLSVRFINQYNTDECVLRGDPFFDVLEKMYQDNKDK